MTPSSISYNAAASVLSRGVTGSPSVEGADAGRSHASGKEVQTVLGKAVADEIAKWNKLKKKGVTALALHGEGTRLP